MQLLHFAAGIVKNCENGKGTDCLTNLPQISATSSKVSSVIGTFFAILAAIAVIVIIIQGIKFAVSNGDSQKAADARKGIIYAVVGLAVALTAEAVVQFVIKKI